MGEISKSVQEYMETSEEIKKRTEERLKIEYEKYLSEQPELVLIDPVRTWKDVCENFRRVEENYRELLHKRNFLKLDIKQEIKKEVQEKLAVQASTEPESVQTNEYSVVQEPNKIEPDETKQDETKQDETEPDLSQIPWDKMPLNCLHDYREYKRKAREEGVNAAAEIMRLLPKASKQITYDENGKFEVEPGYEYYCVSALLRHMLKENLTVYTWAYKHEYEPVNPGKDVVRYKSDILYKLKHKFDYIGEDDIYIGHGYFLPLIMPGAVITPPKEAKMIGIPMEELRDIRTLYQEGYRGLVILIDEESSKMARKDYFECDGYEDHGLYNYHEFLEYTETDVYDDPLDDCGLEELGQWDDDPDPCWDPFWDGRDSKVEDIADYYGWDGTGSPYDFLDNM